MASKSGRQRGERKPNGRERQWSPKFWYGMDFVGWIRLLAANRCAIHWRHWHQALLITCLSLFHTVWRGWSWVLAGRRARRTRIDEEPVFIIGHWRAGTTLLHELLVQDERHTYATTFECLVPNHFLISEDFATRWLRFLLPSRRPMDNMPAGWEHPQEDEFALCNLGMPSPYLTMAFPNHPPQHTEYLTLEGLSERALRRWKNAFFRFLQQITYRNPRRIVLKSPAHTCRIRVLLEIFPGARFVHIVRDPFVVFPSTVHLWKKLYERHGLQRPTFAGLEDYVFDTFDRMYDKFENERGLIDPGRLCEVRYEDLVRDPIGEMQTVYEKLDLGDFDQALPAIEEYLAGMEGYETNRYRLSPELRDKIARRWESFIRQYGYSCEPAGVGLAVSRAARARTAATSANRSRGTGPWISASR